MSRLASKGLCLGAGVAAFLFFGCISGNHELPALAVGCEFSNGGIIRGPTEYRRLALVFTGHQYAEGASVILDGLSRHRARASFFLTGSFLASPQFARLVRRMKAEGHYLGPHSNNHLLYCDWSAPAKTLVSQDQFRADLLENVARLPAPFSHPPDAGFFLPAYEHYNAEIAAWSAAMGFTVVNFTPGTRSNADYTGEADRNFVSSEAILDSILKREGEDPSGLNGFILLLHLGSGPGRIDKFTSRFAALLDTLAGRGYEFVRIDELLAPEHK